MKSVEITTDKVKQLKLEIKKIMATQVWKSADGKIFESKEDCLSYETLSDGRENFNDKLSVVLNKDYIRRFIEETFAKMTDRCLEKIRGIVDISYLYKYILENGTFKKHPYSNIEYYFITFGELWIGVSYRKERANEFFFSYATEKFTLNAEHSKDLRTESYFSNGANPTYGRVHTYGTPMGLANAVPNSYLAVLQKLETEVEDLLDKAPFLIKDCLDNSIARNCKIKAIIEDLSKQYSL